jgi:acyl carrier protein
MREQILEAIKGAVHGQVMTITEDTMVEKLVVDSMDTVEILAVLSTRFKAPLEPREMKHIKTVGDLIDYTMANQGKARGKPPLTIF